VVRLECGCGRKASQVLRFQRSVYAKDDQSRGIQRSEKTPQRRQEYAGRIQDYYMKAIIEKCSL